MKIGVFRMSNSSEGRLMMLFPLLILVFFCSLFPAPADSHAIQKRAAFYIANETMCIVDGDVYRNGDPVPTDDECERCTCRPPGFSCVLRDCDTKPGCKAVRKVGECCPEYVCGCVHNNRLYEDGELIKDLQNNCYTCRCHGSSISCTFADCRFRGDCQPEYLEGECCPRYDHCPPESTTSTTTTRATPPANEAQEEIDFVNFTTHHIAKFTSEDTTVTIQDIVSAASESTTLSYEASKDMLVTIKFTLSNDKLSSIHDHDITELTTLLPLHTSTYKETTRYIIPPSVTELAIAETHLATEEVKHLDENATSIGIGLEFSKDLASTPETDHSSQDFGTRDKNKIISVKGGILVTEQSKAPTSDSTEIDVEENKIVFVQEAGTTEFSTIEEREGEETMQPTFVTGIDLDGQETNTLHPDTESITDSFISNSTKVDFSKASDDVSTYDSHTTFKITTSNEIITESTLDGGEKLSIEDHAVSIVDERPPQSTTLQTPDSTVSYASESIGYDSEKPSTQKLTTFDKDLEVDITEDIKKQFGVIYKEQTTLDTTQTFHSTTEDISKLEQRHTTLSEEKASTEYGTEDSFSTDDNKITTTYDVKKKTSDKDQLHTVIPTETTKLGTDDNTETFVFTTTETRTSHNLEDTDENPQTSTVSRNGESETTKYITKTSIFTKVDIETSSPSDDGYDDYETSSDISSTTGISKTHNISNITSTDTLSVINLENISSHTVIDDFISNYSPTETTSTSKYPLTPFKFTENEDEAPTASTEISAAETTIIDTDLHENEYELVVTTFKTIETGESFINTVSSDKDIASPHGTTIHSNSKDDNFTTSGFVESNLTEDTHGFSTIRDQVTESETEEKTETLPETHAFSTHTNAEPDEKHVEVTNATTLDRPVFPENDAEEVIGGIAFETTIGETSSIPSETTTKQITTVKQIVNKTLESDISIYTEDDKTTDEDLKETTQAPSFSISPEGIAIDLNTKSSSDSQVFFANTLNEGDVRSTERDETFKTSSSNIYEPLGSTSTTEDNSATINFQTKGNDTTPEVQFHLEDATTNEVEDIKTTTLRSIDDENDVKEENVYTSRKDSVTTSDYTSTTVKACESCIYHHGHGSGVTEMNKADKDISTEFDSDRTLSTSDTLNAKHHSELFTSKEELITSPTPTNDEALTTQENDIPREIPQFKPPLVNILKQSMFTNKQTIINEDNLTSNQTDNNHTALNKLHNENALEKHTLTLAEDISDSISSIDNLLEEDKINVFVLNHDYTLPESEVEIFDTEVDPIAKDIENQSHIIKDEKEVILTTSNYNSPSMITSNLDTLATEESTENGGEIPVYIYNEDNIDFVSRDDEENSNSEDNNIEGADALSTLPDSQEVLLEVLPAHIDIESTENTTDDKFAVTTGISRTPHDDIPLETKQYIVTSDSSNASSFYTNSEATAVEENSKNTGFNAEEKIVLRTTAKSYEEQESDNKYQTTEASLLEINNLVENISADNLTDKTSQNSNIFNTEKSNVNIEYNLTDSEITTHSENTEINENVSIANSKESIFEVGIVSTEQSEYSREIANITESDLTQEDEKVTQNTEKETTIPLTSVIEDNSSDPNLIKAIQDISSTHDSNIETSENETAGDHKDTSSTDEYKATTAEIKILFGQEFTPINEKSSATTENQNNSEESSGTFEPEPSISNKFHTEYENKVSNRDDTNETGGQVHEIEYTETYAGIASSSSSPDSPEIYDTHFDDIILSGNIPPLPISLKHMNKHNVLSNIDKTSSDSSLENNERVFTTNITKEEHMMDVTSESSYADIEEKVEPSDKIEINNISHDIQYQNSNVNYDKSNEVIGPSVTVYEETVEYQDGEVSENNTSLLINLNINPSNEKSTDLVFDISNEIVNSSSFPGKELLNSTSSKDSTEDLEESHSPFTILEYLGNFFSTFSTFSEDDTTSHQTLTSTNEKYLESGTDSPEKFGLRAANSTLISNYSYSSLLKEQFAEYGYLGGVIITGQSKYNGTASVENKTQESDENSAILNESNGENIIAADHHLDHQISETDINSKIYSTSSINEDMITDIDFSTNIASDSPEDPNTAETNIISNSKKSAINDHSSQSTLDEIKTISSLLTNLQGTDVTTEMKDNLINPTIDATEREFSTDINSSESSSNIIMESNSEKVEKLEETTEPSFADLYEKNTSVSVSLDSTESLPQITTEIQIQSFPKLIPLDKFKNGEISKDDEASNTEEILDEMNSTTNYDVNFNSTASLSISTELESKIDSTLISGNVPPLPIFFKNMNETQKSNTVENFSNFTLDAEENNSSHVENSSSISLTKQVDGNISDVGRNIQHPMHYIDIISKVFKAPGYDSEFLFNSWRGFSPLQIIKKLRSRRDLKNNSGGKQPTRTDITDSPLISFKQSDQTTSATKEDYAINKKNVLLVEGHGYKPSDYFPVTSSFIIVQSDEEVAENEHKKNTRRKTAEPEPNRETTSHDTSSTEKSREK